MKEAIKNNKKIIIISIAIILLLLIGIAFAYLVTTLYGEKEYLVRAGSLGLRLEEGNELTLSSQIPLEDSEGMSLNGFNFSLVNEGNIETDYTIYLDDLELDEGETRMPDSAIRYSLTRNEEVIGPKNLTSMGSNPNRRVDFGTIGIGETINYTLRIWIDYDATTEEASGKTFKGKLRVVAKQPVGEKISTVLLDNIPKENQYDDGVDTFITGEDPNNYIWYSGKLWRAVSVNNESKTTKLVTQWNISAINYSSGSTDFEGSFMEEWLNDTTVDGFLGNLREPDKFIVMDAKWDATNDNRDLGSITRPNGTSVVTDAVGLLNSYEYQSSDNGGTDGYLNNGTDWVTLSPYRLSYIRYVDFNGNLYRTSPHFGMVRPSINLKSNVRVVSGDGTKDNPYRLNGDNDTNLTGTKLSSRYSGEYVQFGTGENNLYQIVSHENGSGTKIVSAEPLKDSGIFKEIAFNVWYNVNYSSTTIIGTFLNNDFLNNGEYMTSEQRNMIEDSTTWYLGTQGVEDNYKLTKYKDVDMTDYTTSTDAKVGLLRFGELMLGHKNDSGVVSTTWTLTPENQTRLIVTSESYTMALDANLTASVRPSMNLKSNVVITSGDGTKNNPFQIELAS